MTERVGHAQQRRLLQPPEGPVGDEVLGEVALGEERVFRRIGPEQPRRMVNCRATDRETSHLMRSPSHSTAMLSPIARIWISLPLVARCTPSSDAKLPLSNAACCIHGRLSRSYKLANSAIAADIQSA